MLMILIAWIVLMLFGVIVCRMAALGDSAHSDATDPGRWIRAGLMIWEDESQIAVQDNRERMAQRG
jgi:hypothetical protein